MGYFSPNINMQNSLAVECILPLLILFCLGNEIYGSLAWVTRRCPGWFKIGIKKSIETQEPSPPLEDHLCAKFRPDPSSRLDFYREQTDRHTDRHCPLCIRLLSCSTLKQSNLDQSRPFLLQLLELTVRWSCSDWQLLFDIEYKFCWMSYYCSHL